MGGRSWRYAARGVAARGSSARSVASSHESTRLAGDPPAENHDRQFELLFAELQRRLASQDRRLANTETRANTLIASAAILAGLLVAAPLSYDILVALVVNIAAAGFGIATMFPRALEELSPRKMRDKLLEADGEQAALHLSDKYLQLIEKTERWISLRMRLIQAGLGTLGVSLVLAAVAISKQVVGG